MPSTSEMQSEIPDSIHRRGIGYFSVSSARVDSRQEIERYVQNNLAAWGQTYGPGQPYVLYNHAAGRYELEWHRPKTVQEQDREARYEQQRLIAHKHSRGMQMLKWDWLLSRLRTALSWLARRSTRTPRCTGPVFKRVLDPLNPRLECLYLCHGDTWILHRCGPV
jgi:hypothetical protein